MNLGIPQKNLHLLYISCIDFHGQAPIQIIHKTNLIMVANPAHQTALNARKRLMLEGHLDVAQELRFTQLLLRNIKHCAKESILWEHRRWCLKTLHGILRVERPLDGETNRCWASPDEVASLFVPSPAIVRQEFSIARAACSVYPRNYHGWTHWHNVFNSCYASLRYTKSSDSELVVSAMLEECDNLSTWVESHVSDYSAIYQYYLATRLFYDLLDSHPHLFVEEAKEKISSRSPHALAEQFNTLISRSSPREPSLLLGLGLVKGALPQKKRMHDNVSRCHSP